MHGGVSQFSLADKYDPEDPRVRRLVEEAREAHWKLTAPKGFAALKVTNTQQQQGKGKDSVCLHFCAAQMSF